MSSAGLVGTVLPRRLLVAYRTDLLLQFRQGFYYVYAVLTVLYIIILHLLPEVVRDLILPFIIFTDPAIAGFFFIGAIVFLEKSDGTQQALFSTPLRLNEYLLSKVLSLTTLAILTSLAIALLTVGFGFNIILLIMSVILTSILFIYLGLAIVSRFKVLNHYLFGAGLGIGALCLPLLDYFGLVETALFWILPTQPALVLISAAFTAGKYAMWELVISLVLLVAWITLSRLWARRWFSRYILGWQGKQ